MEGAAEWGNDHNSLPIQKKKKKKDKILGLTKDFFFPQITLPTLKYAELDHKRSWNY